MHRNLIRLGALAAVIVASSLFWLLVIEPVRANARIATGYVAKTVCSCIFIDARKPAACMTDLDPRYSSVRFHLDEPNRSVRAIAGIVSSDVATFDPQLGCQLK
jgi:hypothetical protein